MDQVINQAAKSRYGFGGQAQVPLVIRAPVHYTISSSAHHSDRPWGLFAQAPGLPILAPATPCDAKGLLKTAIRNDNPLLFLEDVTVSSIKAEIPESEYTIPIGSVDIKRQGLDISVVSIAKAVPHCLRAAETLHSEGMSAEVIDILSVVPLDRQTIPRSVAKTGRLIVVDHAPGTCGLAAEVCALVAENVFDRLRAPVTCLTGPDVPVPFSPYLERLMFHTADALVTAVRQLCTPAEEAMVAKRSARRLTLENPA